VLRLGISASIVVAAAATVAAFALTPAGARRASSAARPTCPTHLYQPTTRAPDRKVEAVLEAARRQIPAAYRGRWVNQSGVVKLSPSTYDLTAIFAAGSRGRYLREAAHACGGRVARASWVVIFEVPEAQSAMLGTGTAFFAPTGPRHWRLWYPR
jgi:hypothetical protein